MLLLQKLQRTSIVSDTVKITDFFRFDCPFRMDFPRKQSPVFYAKKPLSFACSHGLGMLHNLHYGTGSGFRFPFIFIAVGHNVNYVKYSLRPSCRRTHSASLALHSISFGKIGTDGLSGCGRKSADFFPTLAFRRKWKEGLAMRLAFHFLRNDRQAPIERPDQVKNLS